MLIRIQKVSLSSLLPNPRTKTLIYNLIAFYHMGVQGSVANGTLSPGRIWCVHILSLKWLPKRNRIPLLLVIILILQNKVGSDPDPFTKFSNSQRNSLIHTSSLIPALSLSGKALFKLKFSKQMQMVWIWIPVKV